MSRPSPSVDRAAILSQVVALLDPDPVATAAARAERLAANLASHADAAKAIGERVLDLVEILLLNREQIGGVAFVIMANPGDVLRLPSGNVSEGFSGMCAPSVYARAVVREALQELL